MYICNFKKIENTFHTVHVKTAFLDMKLPLNFGLNSAVFPGYSQFSVNAVKSIS